MSSSGGRTQTLIATVAAAGIVQLPTAAIVVALPTIRAEFDASLAELQWTVTATPAPAWAPETANEASGGWSGLTATPNGSLPAATVAGLFGLRAPPAPMSYWETLVVPPFVT